MMRSLSESELKRYDRQIRIPFIGVEKQKKLKNASVMIAGIGGLGSIASLYLAAAGVGRIKLVDHGRVELSNLNRQLLYMSDELGEPKAIKALEKLKRLNPSIEVQAINETINESSIDHLLEDVDLVLDGMDNFKTRFIINRGCVERGIPYIYAAVYMLEGRLMTIIPRSGPCLRCLMPEEPEEHDIVPILGPVAGVMGALEAVEAIKLLAGFGESSVGRLLIFDGESLSFHEIRVEKDPECPVCGKK